MPREKHDAFKYVKPDAPTESGLYWPEMADDIWSYCYYLGSWTPHLADQLWMKHVGRDIGKYDLGVWVPSKSEGERGVSDATVDCAHNYHSGEICIPSYLGYHCDDQRNWRDVLHYGEVLKRALKYGFKVRAWHEGPVVSGTRSMEVQDA